MSLYLIIEHSENLFYKTHCLKAIQGPKSYKWWSHSLREALRAVPKRVRPFRGSQKNLQLSDLGHSYIFRMNHMDEEDTCPPNNRPRSQDHPQRGGKSQRRQEMKTTFRLGGVLRGKALCKSRPYRGPFLLVKPEAGMPTVT